VPPSLEISSATRTAFSLAKQGWKQRH